MEPVPSNHKYFLKNARNFCADRLLELDRDLYRASLYAGPARDALQALFLLMTEIEAIPALVTEPMMGTMRIKWWYDNLSKTEGDGRTLLLGALIQEFDEKKLDRDGVLSLLETMQAELATPRFQNPAEWPAYHHRKAAALTHAALLDDRFIPCLAPFLALRTLKSMAANGAILLRACPPGVAQPANGRLPPETARILAHAVPPCAAGAGAPPLLRHIAAFHTLTLRRLDKNGYDITRPGFVRMGGFDLLRLWQASR